MSNPRCQGSECSKELKRESIAAFFKPGGEPASQDFIALLIAACTDALGLHASVSSGIVIA